MRRREFVSACVGSALAAATPALPGAALPHQPAAAESEGVPFSLSVMLWTVFRDLPFPQRLEKVAEAGYHAVELVDEFKNWKKQDFADARRKMRELHLEFDATAGVWHSLVDPAEREVFLKALVDFAPILNELECRRLILQTGNKVPGLTQKEMFANFLETVQLAGKAAAANNIELLIENIDPEENPKYFLTSSSDGFELIHAVGNPHVKFLYDFFHEQIAEGNLIAKLEKNIDLVGLVHVADVPGRHYPGTGEINYANIFRKLAELRYSGFVAMEFKPLADPVKELREARELALSSARSANPAASFQSWRKHESA